MLFQIEIGTCAPLLAASFPFTTVAGSLLMGVLVVLAFASLYVLRSGRQVGPARPHHPAARVVYILFLLTTLALAVTSLGQLFRADHMSGWPLLAHLASSGLFIVLLPLMAIAYLPWGSPNDPAYAQSAHRWWLVHWSSWLLILSAIVTAGTMLVGMQPLLDTTGLRAVTEIHGYAGLITLLANITHACGLFWTRLGYR